MYEKIIRDLIQIMRAAFCLGICFASLACATSPQRLPQAKGTVFLEHIEGNLTVGMNQTEEIYYVKQCEFLGNISGDPQNLILDFSKEHDALFHPNEAQLDHFLKVALIDAASSIGATTLLTSLQRHGQYPHYLKGRAWRCPKGSIGEL